MIPIKAPPKPDDNDPAILTLGSVSMDNRRGLIIWGMGARLPGGIKKTFEISLNRNMAIDCAHALQKASLLLQTDEPDSDLVLPLVYLSMRVDHKRNGVAVTYNLGTGVERYFWPHCREMIRTATALLDTVLDLQVPIGGAAIGEAGAFDVIIEEPPNQKLHGKRPAQ